MRLVIVVCLVLVPVSTPADLAPAGDGLAEWAEAFSPEHECGLSMAVTRQRFEARFPGKAREPALLALWRAAAAHPRRDIIRVRVLLMSDVAMPSLRRLVALAAQARDARLRSAALGTYRRLGREAAGAETLAFLGDSDDTIRADAVRAISAWPDGVARLSAYVAAHGASAGHRESLASARAILAWRVSHAPVSAAAGGRASSRGRP